ncbi:uncharacterized protein Bfra_008960 [Botrytis fragariae]|uniref:Uncharacterized protein n=1 Tax=Botrytis fragariae TaxID=1964551 RepID=A0A8H6EGX4_9HELO|nr:uncharacterized protein Bfra_008960 [Botrytis fragariae]KAF5871934.1 hypothetical protein Bfra_008960 [Botrytis fragariae]
MTRTNHDDGSQSIQGEQTGSNHGDGSQSTQREQPTQQNQHVVHESNNSAEFDFSTLRQHSVLTIEKTADNAKMILDLDFSQPESVPDIGALLKILMDYAEIIKEVKIIIKAPKQYDNAATFKGKLASVAMVMAVLNSFNNLTKVEVLARLDDHDSFEQLDLTLAAYQLNFYNWTLAYEVLGLDGKWDISVDSEDELRLRRVYRKLFLKKR